jgi:hypothetical protein
MSTLQAARGSHPAIRGLLRPGLAGGACRLFCRNGLLLPGGLDRFALRLKDLPGDDQGAPYAV